MYHVFNTPQRDNEQLVVTENENQDMKCEGLFSKLSSSLVGAWDKSKHRKSERLNIKEIKQVSVLTGSGAA